MMSLQREEETQPKGYSRKRVCGGTEFVVRSINPGDKRLLNGAQPPIPDTKRRHLHLSSGHQRLTSPKEH